jgi:alpha-tubulin suppressor-like RCC1 family protein
MSHTCWVRGGAVWCAGWGASGAIGDGNTTNRNSPTRVSGIRNALGTIGGDGHQCANLSDGTVKCWGFGGHGQLGNGANTNQLSPVVVRDLSGVVELAATHNTTCARKSNGRVWCWGSNNNHNLGLGQTTMTATNVPQRAVGIDAATSLRSGADHFCVRIGDNTARCWGHNYYYQSSNNSDRGARARAVTVAGIGAVTAVEPGGYFTCALKANGQVLCWGYNHHGELGRGTNGTEQLGAEPVRDITTATAIAAGRHHACALLQDRTMRCWGYNGVGELGDGTWSHRNTPVVVRNLSNVVKMDFNGLEHASCASTSGLGMYCWGRNHRGGKLGLGHESNRNTPQRVPMVSIGN